MPANPMIGQRPELHALVEALVTRRERMLVLEGVAGRGKTFLVNRFALEHYGAFLGGISTVSGCDFDAVDLEHLEKLLSVPGPMLLIFDEFDTLAIEQHRVLQVLMQASARNLELQVLLVARNGVLGGEIPHVFLAPLNHADSPMQLRRFAIGAEMVPSRVLDLIGGNPLMAELLGRAAGDYPSWQALTEAISARPHHGLLGPDGRPLSSDSSAGRQLIARAGDVNAELLRRAQKNPELMYELTPRRFEELTATLFESLGFEVELTPASKDGGKDLYIARSDVLGRCLYYVECKRYAPNRPVGVDLVNALTGVVERGRATMGLLVTTSRFTSGAREAQRFWEHRLTLKDYADLKLMLDEAVERR